MDVAQDKLPSEEHLVKLGAVMDAALDALRTAVLHPDELAAVLGLD